MPKYKKQKVDYRVSQNFLTGGETIRRLLRLTDITRADTVVEIGAGRGHITRALARRSGRVLAYEIDPALSAYLAGRLPENVRLIRGDFLRAALPKGPYKVFANLPFCITTAALRRLTESGRPPEKAWLVLEKGAALRFCGEESRAGLGLRPFFETKIVYYFRREEFHPAPAADPVLLRLVRRTRPDVPPERQRDYLRFLAHGFRYGLWGGRALLTRRQAAAALRAEGLPPLPPSGTARYVQWLCLFRAWQRLKGG